MEHLAEPLRLRFPAVRAPGLAASGAWFLGFAVALYLALQNGGYDIAERSELGLVAWWVIAFLVGLGALGAASISRSAKVLLTLVLALTVWTTASLGWTGSDERTAIEVARLATYAGFLLLAVVACGNGRWRYVLWGLTCAAAVVIILAVFSRLEPTLFPERVSEEFLKIEDLNRRLAYPFNYSSALGAFAGLAAPLLLGASSTARSMPVRCAAAVLLPLVALVVWLTASGLSVLVLAVALLAFLVLAEDRLPKIATLIVSGAGGAILCAAVAQRDALDQGLTSAQALQQGDEMQLIAVIVCLGVGLIHAAITLLERHAERPHWLVPSPRRTAVFAAGAVFVGVALSVLFGGFGEVSDAVDDFKSREGAAPGSARGVEILQLSGSGRYQLWDSAVDAGNQDPLTGIGAGTYEFWWSSNGSYGGFVRDAHSLYLEFYAELGVIGLALILAIVIAVVAVGVKRVTQYSAHTRNAMAAATAAAFAFAVAAGFDWLWELSALPVMFLILAAIIVSARPRPSSDHPVGDQRVRGERLSGRTKVLRAVGAVACLVPILAISGPLAGTRELEASRADVARGDLDSALQNARDAQAVQPYAASPRLQEALVLELQGEYAAASVLATEATEREPDNWRNWLILSRLEARDGDVARSVEAFRTARSLNPLSPTFATQ